MSGIKTGNKGFVNPADGKVYTIDPNGNADEVSTTYDPGDMTVDQTVKDVNKKTKITLANYLSKATLGKAGASTTANAYPIDESTSSTIESSLTTSTGYPSPLTPASSGNLKIFTTDIPSSISNNYAKGTNTVGQGAGAITTLLSKGKSEESATKKLLDGNELLQGVTKDQNVVTLPAPLGAYFSAAITPNYRTETATGQFTNEDILNPSKAFNPSLLNFFKLKMAAPNVETVSKEDLSLKLDGDPVKIQQIFNWSVPLAAKNFFPISAPVDLGLDSPSPKLASLMTTEGFTSPLTVPSSQNNSIFNDISSGYSYSKNWPLMWQIIPIGSFKKGNSKGNQDAITGNVLVSKEQLNKADSPIRVYQAWSITPNYRNTAGQFTTEDILSPSGKFDYKLIDYSSLQKVEPKDEAVKSSDLKLTLSSIFNFASKLTNPDKDFISLTTSVKNAYPVSAPDKFSADSLHLITTDGLPSPLSAGTNKNAFVFNDNLPSSYSAEFDSVSGQFKKGKQNAPGVDGHALLSKSIITDSFGFTKLNAPLRNYFENVAVVNFFYPDILSKDSNEKAFLSKQIDVSSPPRSFEPIINIGTSFGKYSGKESLKTQWNLIDQRKKASEVTQVNQYSVDPPVGGLIPTNDPSTSLPLPLVQNNNDSYVKREDIKPLSRDPSIQNFSKGKESANLINGNELLKNVPGGVPGINESNPLHNYVGGRGAPVLSVGNNKWINSARPEAAFNPTMKLADGRVVSHLKLAQVGTGLLQRAAAEIPAWTSSPDNKFNPTSGIADVGALVPSVAQLGILKVNNALLEASDVLNSLSGVSNNGEISGEEDELAAEGLLSIAPFDGQSWGTLTTPSEPFGGGGIGLVITMLALVIAINILFGLFSLVKNERNQKKNYRGQLTLGKYKYSPVNDSGFLASKFSLESLLGIKPTNNSFTTCLGVGSLAFFIGAANSRLTAAQIALAATGIGLGSVVGDSSAVGANLVVARTIVRSGVVIAQVVENLVKNPVGLLNISSVLGAIRSSKVIAAINVFSRLGDALLDREYGMVIGADGNPQQGTAIDNINPNSFHSSVRKNRMTSIDLNGNVKFDQTLAWATKRAPSLYLTTPSISYVQSTGQLGSFAGITALSSADKTGKNKTVYKNSKNIDGRIDTDDRIAIEKYLDAEYIPFYFHDVRTNEIISFHAFLTSLGDSYSSAYDSVEGFGRVEPVKIYKGTQRKIDLSFIVASTSEDDFSHMWAKLNKLTTMVYPQYTAGRTLLGQDYQFKAPFSQLIGSTPLIRIRLGDLLRSNYSKFNLARLFGLLDKDSLLPSSTTTARAVKGADINKKVPEQVEDFKKKFREASTAETRKEFLELELDAEKTLTFIKSLPSGVLSSINASSKVTVNQNQDGKFLAAGGLLSVDVEKINSAKIVNVDNQGQYVIEAEVVVSLGGLASSFFSSFLERPGVTVTDEESGKKKIKFKSSVPSNLQEHLELSNASVLGKLQLEGGPFEASAAFVSAISDFMGDNNNVIVKSFESAGGKGLAGVIESMNFDWYTSTTWEIYPGYSAPKMCKVTLSFSVIHDITPGIDHAGYNRAPIYPVGAAMKHREEA